MYHSVKEYFMFLNCRSWFLSLKGRVNCSPHQISKTCWWGYVERFRSHHVCFRDYYCFFQLLDCQFQVIFTSLQMSHGLSLEVSCNRPFLTSKNSIDWLNFVYIYTYIPISFLVTFKLTHIKLYLPFTFEK